MDQEKSTAKQKVEWAIRIDSAARKYTRAYDIRRRGPKKLTPEKIKKAADTMESLRTLVAVCELYQREVPGAREEIEDLIRRLDENKRNRGAGTP